MVLLIWSHFIRTLCEKTKYPFVVRGQHKMVNVMPSTEIMDLRLFNHVNREQADEFRIIRH